jgi:hypothetical protein
MRPRWRAPLWKNILSALDWLKKVGHAQWLPQVLHAPPPQLAQPAPLECVTVRPSECAKKTEILREVCSPWHFWQRMGASASLNDRKASNWL